MWQAMLQAQIEEAEEAAQREKLAQREQETTQTPVKRELPSRSAYQHHSVHYNMHHIIMYSGFPCPSNLKLPTDHLILHMCPELMTIEQLQCTNH